MKNLFNLLICLICFSCFAQQKKQYDIHILINESDNGIITKNDTLVYQQFQLKNQKKSNIIYSIDEKGKLNYSVKGNTSHKKNIIFLEYMNQGNNNVPFVKKTTEIKNVLKYPEDFYVDDLSNIFTILDDAENIYVIEKNDIKGFHVLKKVKIVGR